MGAYTVKQSKINVTVMLGKFHHYGTKELFQREPLPLSYTQMNMNNSFFVNPTI
jgi:hypothetical protein